LIDDALNLFGDVRLIDAPVDKYQGGQVRLTSLVYFVEINMGCFVLDSDDFVDVAFGQGYGQESESVGEVF
jgi:hypothetical protein